MSLEYYGVISYDIKSPPGRIALRRKGRCRMERPAVGGESCKQDSFLFTGNQVVPDILD